MNRIHVEKAIDEPSEISERKGLGHPDTICDLLAESISLNLSRHYLEHFGLILHHNVDKILLAGGRSLPKFGGGECQEPIRLFIAGRATSEYKEKKIPVDEILHHSLDGLLRDRFAHLTANNFEIINAIRPGSVDLVELFERGFESGTFLANDSSSGVGYAPLSTLETVVLQSERYLNSPEGKRAFPQAGEDIKIMGMRQGERISLTAGIAFVDQHIKDIHDYAQMKTRIEKALLERGSRLSPNLELRVNTGDDIERGSVYITVTGSSAEAGDDGEVGRGNRPNGLISPYRPMTMEAIAGKNPVTHVGKLYNWIAMEIAEAVAALDGIERCYCYLVSRIGHPVSEPYFRDIRIWTADGRLSDVNRKAVDEIVSERLRSLKDFGVRIVREGKLLVI